MTINYGPDNDIIIPTQNNTTYRGLGGDDTYIITRAISDGAKINIVDTKGNIVFTKPIEVNSGINMYVIQKQLSPGIYYIHIENGTMRTTVVKHSIR